MDICYFSLEFHADIIQELAKILTPIDTFFKEHVASVMAICSIATAITTIVLVLLNRSSVKLTHRILLNGRRMEHTDRVKRTIIEPWIEELKDKLIGYPFKSCRERIAYYKGEELNVEKEPLFSDLKNHFPDVINLYEELKNIAGKLYRECAQLEKDVESYVRSKLGLVGWNKAYRNVEEALKEGGFYESDETLCFFLDALLNNRGGKLYSHEYVNKELGIEELTFHYEEGKSGEYISKSLSQSEKDKVLKEVENVLKELRSKFINRADEVKRLKEDLEAKRENLLEKLEEVMEYMVLPGICKYVNP